MPWSMVMPSGDGAWDGQVPGQPGAAFNSPPSRIMVPMRPVVTLLKSPAAMTGLAGAASRRWVRAMTWVIWPH